MSCERYKSWIEDAAADALEPRHEAELNAHLEGCAACRALLERERALAAAIDSTVIASVEGQPSPYFAAKVRARISDEPQRAAGFVQWLPLAAGALVVIAAVGIWFFRSNPTPTQPAIATSPQPNTSPAQAAETVPPVAVEHHNLPRVQPPAPQPLHVLVAPGEKAGFQQLAEFARSQRLAAEALPRVAEVRKPLETPELKIKPIEIAALDLLPKPAEPPATDQPRR